MHRRKQPPEPQTFIIHKSSEDYEVWDKETKALASKKHTKQTIIYGLFSFVKDIAITCIEIRNTRIQAKIDLEMQALRKMQNERQKRMREYEQEDQKREQEDQKREQERLEDEIRLEKNHNEIMELLEEYSANTVRN